MSKIFAFLKDRLNENSPRTVIAMGVAAVVGVRVSPENQELIVNALIAGLTVVAAFWGQDKKSE